MIDKEEAEYIFQQIAYGYKTYKDLSKEFNAHHTTLCKWMKSFKEEFGLDEKEKYCIKTYLRYKYKDEIVKKYLEGESTKQIATEYNASDDHMIAELLRESNVQIRSVGYKSRTDQTLFQEINNEVEAYTLGLITADGSISKNYSITITLHENDKYILEKINKELLNNSGTISQTANRTTVRLVFNGKQICNNLKQYCIVPNKSHVMTSIYILEDEQLMQHYIRGLFDGDGVCSKSGNNRLRLGYCAHIKQFTETFQDFMCQKLQLRKNKLFDTGGS